MTHRYHEELLSTCDRLEKMGIWNSTIFDFLKRPVALGLMNDSIEQSNKTSDEAVLVLISALNYVYGHHYQDQNSADFFTALTTSTDFEGFVVKHHDQIFHLCVHQRVQANIPARALPVLELIYRRFGSEAVRVIELGASAGLLGMVMLHTDLVQRNPQDFFLAGQQMPNHWPLISKYQGYDVVQPKTDWIIACIHQAELRKLCQRCLSLMARSSNFSLHCASALDFPNLPEIPNSNSGNIVILTSYMLYQLSADERQQLVNSITEYLAHNHGMWLNLDLYTDSLGKNRFIAQVDGVTVLTLTDDYCQSWQEV